ncbi:MAG: ABC transporter permease [Bernardetiaceae bacterium]|nr:ABC transporter permease [Bernardetiaceae bacterium]
MQRYLTNLGIAWEALLGNKLRSLLTALGIIFGVAAVIAMLAIGNGAQQEILDQLKLVGVNNIVITPIVEDKNDKKTDDDADDDTQENSKKFSPGLTLSDVHSIQKILPTAQRVSPEIEIELPAVRKGKQRRVKLIGVTPTYFEIIDFKLSQGKMFSQRHLEYGEPVCIIGRSVQAKFFNQENPIGKEIKCGNQWLRIIGVLEMRETINESIGGLSLDDYNMNIYSPVQTLLVRYENRAQITEAAIRKADEERRDGKETQNLNYHQIDRLIVQVDKSDNLSASAEIIARMLRRRHFEADDFRITIPELLLKQQQRTKDIFNIVLGAIAGISLLVGGIGIMNIMLASVLERIKEIGLRLSLGAKKQDIISQFMFEAMLISISGGVIGIVLGVLLSVLVAHIAEIPTLISFASIALSFLVSASIGLIFGIAPARKAANQNPIESLRYE